MIWNSEQYLTFADARKRPALDLLARIGCHSASAIVDLVCGADNITRLLAEPWPAASILGIDNDLAMLTRTATTPSTIHWQRAEIGSWRADFPPDLIFSNALLHWLDGHPHLLPTRLGQLAAGGVLEVQMPANFSAPSHRILLDLVAEARWRDMLRGVRMGSVLPPADYHQLLMPLCRHLGLWQTTYWQLLSGDDAVFEWMKGTTLVPFLARLDTAVGEKFLGEYRQRLRIAYPQQTEVQTLFPFKRMFFVAHR